MYYNNELHNHKKSDMVKWIVAFTLIIALVCAVVGLSLQVSGVFDKDDETSSEEEVEAESFIVDSPVFNGVSMEISQLNVDETEAVAAVGSSYELSATLTGKDGNPPLLVDTTLEWSLEWTGDDISWGESSFEELGSPDPSTFVSIGNSGYSHQVNLSLLKAFGRRILVKCQLKDHPEIFATCTLKYKERIEKIILTAGSELNCVYTVSGASIVYDYEQPDNYFGVSLDEVYSKLDIVKAKSVYTEETVLSTDYSLKKLSLKVNDGYVSTEGKSINMSSDKCKVHDYVEVTGSYSPVFTWSVTWDLINEVYGLYLRTNGVFLSFLTTNYGSGQHHLELAVTLQNKSYLIIPVYLKAESLKNPVASVQLAQSEITF